MPDDFHNTRQPDISIIVPAYNTSAVIGQTIESVRLQQGVTWEMIIVDDRSTDDTLAIALQYASLDPRIHVYVNKGPKGPGSARNMGICLAKGEAVYFLDSDDVLLPDVLSQLFNRLATHRLDAVYGYIVLFCSLRMLRFAIPQADRVILDPEVGFSHFCCYLYRTDFLRRHNLLFPEDLFIGEDRYFLYQVYTHLKMVHAINLAVFLYRVNHKPIALSPGHAWSYLNHMSKSRALFDEMGKPDWTIRILERELVGLLPRYLHFVMTTCTEEDRLAYLRQIMCLFAGLEDKMGDLFEKAYGEQGRRCLELCSGTDVTAFCKEIQKSGMLLPMSRYMGIERPAYGMSWLIYRLTRPLANFLLSEKNRFCVLYLRRLKIASRKNLANSRDMSEDAGSRL